jgi:hypothetical protein
MNTVYTVKKLGVENVSYNLRSSRYTMTKWQVVDGKAQKITTKEAYPTHIDGVFGYKAFGDFFPSTKDAGSKRHVVKSQSQIGK